MIRVGSSDCVYTGAMYDSNPNNRCGHVQSGVSHEVSNFAVMVIRKLLAGNSSGPQSSFSSPQVMWWYLPFYLPGFQALIIRPPMCPFP